MLISLFGECFSFLVISDKMKNGKDWDCWEWLCLGEGEVILWCSPISSVTPFIPGKTSVIPSVLLSQQLPLMSSVMAWQWVSCHTGTNT